ncbi:hypothetical protein F4825DRAFT_474274, partial [Nemania diffusa]
LLGKVGVTIEVDDEKADDDPPLKDGGNATTIGFEFELLVAISRYGENVPDPHPNEKRWLSDNLAKHRGNKDVFMYTARNKIIDELIDGGVSAYKTNEHWASGWQDKTFDWWDSLEYENPNQNDQYLKDWMGNYVWDGSKSEDLNVADAAFALREQFLQYHLDNNLQLYMTRNFIIELVQHNIAFMIWGVAPKEGQERVMTIWFEQVTDLITDQKRRHYSASENIWDPDIPPGLEFSSLYKAWSCTDDFTIQDSMPSYAHYHRSDFNIPIDRVTKTPIYPPRSYQWFSAEIRSSVLDYDNPNTHPTLRRVCSAIRNTMRVHKPMDMIECGLHVHIGQQAGWTLLHLKKFATLWHLIEPSMYKLHRKIRQQSTWCAPMAEESGLARHVFLRDATCATYAATTTGPTKAAYERQMMAYVPHIDRPQLNEFFANIWQFSTIIDLNQAMRSGSVPETCIRWRISGEKLSARSSTGKTQTLEFRLMQGTFDADHVWKWASMLERLVVFSRDSTAAVFKAAIQDLLEKELPDSIGFNKDDMEWFKARRTDDDYFAYPNPDGMVDWGEPFMVPGYGDTHIP